MAGLTSGFGAGAGADMLQQIQQQQFAQQEAERRDALAQQQLALDQARAQQQALYQAEALKSLQDERAARNQATAQATADKLAGTITPQTTLDPTDPAVTVLRGGNLGFLLQPDKTLDATNISGAGGGPLSMTANPGQLTGKLRYLGTAAQQDALHKRAEQDALLNDPNLTDEAKFGIRYANAFDRNAPANLVKAPAQSVDEPVIRIGRDGTMRQIGTAPKGAHFTQEPTPTQTPTVVVQTVDENGNPVTKIVPKTAGSTFAKAPSATTETRIQSAQAVKQTGDDILSELKDPTFASQLGPAMGRYNSMQEFIGNPPPGFEKIAGQIESFALANMGVHGMRSAQGAQMIRTLLNQRMTPEALAAAIEGLQGFTTHFLENNGRLPKAATSGSTPSAADLIKKYGG